MKKGEKRRRGVADEGDEGVEVVEGGLASSGVPVGKEEGRGRAKWRGRMLVR